MLLLSAVFVPCGNICGWKATLVSKSHRVRLAAIVSEIENERSCDWVGTPANSQRPLVMQSGLPAGASRRQTERGCSLIPASGNRRSDTGGMNNVSGNGFYWSASLSGSTGGYNLNFNSTGVNPSNGNNRANGFQVRCLQAFTRLLKVFLCFNRGKYLFSMPGGCTDQSPAGHALAGERPVNSATRRVPQVLYILESLRSMEMNREREA